MHYIARWRDGRGSACHPIGCVHAGWTIAKQGMNPVSKRILLHLLGCTMLAPAAWAESGNVFTLGEISTSAQADQKTPGTEVLTSEEMRQFDRDTVDEALVLLPGTNLIKRGQRNETSVYIRGFDARQVPVLVDGIPIYVPYDGYVDLGRFTTWDISEIQVSKGATSVLAGPNAMGGVVNLVTRRPQKALEGEAQVKATFDGNGAFNGWETGINAGSKLDKVYVQGSAIYAAQDHWRLPEGWGGPGKYSENGGNRENSDKQDYKLNLKVGLTPNATDEYAINLISQSGAKGSLSQMGDFTVAQTGQRTGWRWPTWDKNSLYWLSNTGFAQSGYVKTRLYYDSFKNRLDTYDTAYNFGNVTNYSWYSDYTWGGNVEVGGNLVDWNTLKGVVHYKKDTHREKANQVTGTRYNEPWQKTDDETYSIGLEDTVHVNKAWDVIGGASYDMRFAGRSDDWRTPNGPMYEVGGKDSQVLNPSISTVYRFSDTGNMHAAIARKSRFPSLKDLYSQRLGGTNLQNPNLDPERVTTYEAGATEQFWGHTRLGATGFYNAISDSIESVNLAGGFTQNRNVGDANTYGLELSARSMVLEKWELGGNYTYTHSWNDLYDRRMLGVPLHKVFTYAKYNPMDTVWVQAAASTQTGYLSLGTNSNRVNAYTLVDLKAHWDLTNYLAAEVGVNNLFDSVYESSPGYTEEGRNYFATLRASF